MIIFNIQIKLDTFESGKVETYEISQSSKLMVGGFCSLNQAETRADIGIDRMG